MTGEETLAYGRRLAATLRPPVVLLARGDLGVGKTVLARGVAEGLGVLDLVTSPSFTLVNEYEAGDHTFVHIDLYRLGEPQELEHLGLEEYLGPKVFAYIEWPEILIRSVAGGVGWLLSLGTRVYEVLIRLESDESRIIEVRAVEATA